VHKARARDFLALRPRLNHSTHRKQVPAEQHFVFAVIRINRAKELLQYPEMSITNVAIDLVFCSSQHFARCFKQQTGVTARAFRSMSRRSPTDQEKSSRLRTSFDD
jgi:transcriptional regulator GlxA family with amidase domain